jgi:hypothetical protein
MGPSVTITEEMLGRRRRGGGGIRKLLHPSFLSTTDFLSLTYKSVTSVSALMLRLLFVQG